MSFIVTAQTPLCQFMPQNPSDQLMEEEEKLNMVYRWASLIMDAMQAKDGCYTATLVAGLEDSG